MGSAQFCSVVKTASLPVLSPDLAPPIPPTVINQETGKPEQACVSLAAGQFSNLTSWGRRSLWISGFPLRLENLENENGYGKVMEHDKFANTHGIF